MVVAVDGAHGRRSDVGRRRRRGRARQANWVESFDVIVAASTISQQRRGSPGCSGTGWGDMWLEVDAVISAIITVDRKVPCRPAVCPSSKRKSRRDEGATISVLGRCAYVPFGMWFVIQAGDPGSG